MDNEEQPVDQFAFDLSMKKKKKKKKTFEDDASGPQEAGAAEDVEGGAADLFSGKKKKKKRGFDDATGQAENESEATKDEKEVSTSEDANMQNFVNSHQVVNQCGYTYDQMLSRLYNLLRLKNPELVVGRKKFNMVAPKVGKEGSKKTVVVNFGELCEMVRRDINHVMQYMTSEMGTTGSLDANRRLIVKGNFKGKQVESLMVNYLNEYVLCPICRSHDTILTKENRLYFLKCESCGASRTVQAIKSGFKAQTEKRSRTKAA